MQPRLVVCLGATAAYALLGPDFRLTKHRGEVIEQPGLPPVTATVHPSSVLRAQDDESRKRQYDGLTTDLRNAVRGLRLAG